MRLRLARPSVAGALAATLFAAAPAAADYLRVYYPDIEQGSATLVVSPTGRALLIDAGSEIRSADDDVVRFIEELMALGIVSTLEGTLATHYDEDHIGHLEDVLAWGLVTAGGKAWDRGTYHSTPSSFAYSDYAFATGFATRQTVTPGQVIDLGGGATATVLVVNGEPAVGSAIDITGSAQFENSASIAVLVEYGDFDLWIGGDLTGNPDEGVTDVESTIGALAGDLDVYTVNHHGSRTSSNATFLADLAAEVAINQNSADNTFGHPRAEIAQRFLDTDDSCGDIPLFVQQNAGPSTDVRVDNSLAAGIADEDDLDAVLGLPGTILLISDGDNYQISGGGVTPLAFATDCLSSPGGDFPPAVLTVDRAPWVPTSAEAVVVSAHVTDEGSITASLEWSLDGVDQTPISMSQVGSTNWYEGTIPAQANGTRVAYGVVAVDSGSQATASRPQGYFAGVTPIADLKVLDGRDALATAEYPARIEGNLTVEPGVFHTFVSQMFVQDGSGGIQVFAPSLLALDRGDLVRVVGELEMFAGQAELSLAQDFGGYGATQLSSGSAPSPTVITVAQAGEAYEGMLVRIDGVTVTAGSIPDLGEGGATLTITDDGGISTLDLRIDEDTDLPGAPTPTQSFDVVGILGQFDSWPTFDDGYQLTPRGRADFLTEEVNVPAVIVHEIHADPHSGTTEGDANGDGVRDAEDDEFVELVNTTYDAIDISGWTVSDGSAVRHTFPASTILPPREAVVVFGGGTPTGDFGNAGAAGLVFTASTGALSLANTADTVTVKNASAAVIQTVTYGSTANDDQSLTRHPAWSNAPMAKHTTVSAARWSPGTWAADGGAFTHAAGSVVVSEVFYDASGTDGGLEWIELVNLSGADIDLAARPISIAWGGGDFTHAGLTLDSGTLPSCTAWVVGGPTSSATNHTPTLDRAEDLDPDVQNGGSTADGVAVFARPWGYVTPATAPLDAVVYGSSNSNCLPDAASSCPAPHVGTASAGRSVERTGATTWAVQIDPTPNSSPIVGGGGLCTPPPPPCLEPGDLTAGDLVISEVLYDPTGSDDGLEWIELYNDSGEEICLDGMSLGWGGADYAGDGVDLTGTVADGDTFLVGGPNGGPTYDQVANFSADLQNSGTDADGVALFTVQEASVTGSTTPYDAVIYGPTNTNCLDSPTNSCPSPDVGDAAAGSSIERSGHTGAWGIQSTPTPGS